MNQLNIERVLWIDGQMFMQAREGGPAMELYFESAQELIDSCEEEI